MIIRPITRPAESILKPDNEGYALKQRVTTSRAKYCDYGGMAAINSGRALEIP
jgi:hypothetical protein